MEKKYVKWIVIGVVVIVVLIAAWYLASPLFLNRTVDEDFPDQQATDGGDVETTILQRGDFMDADSFHQTSGTADIIDIGGAKYLRFEDFETTNGPDLKVYLANDLDAQDYVSLGDLKGNIGNQNYEIPSDVNPDDYQYVLIWCEAFSVLFGSAELEITV